MATTDVSLHAESRQPEPKPVVNDFSIQVATVNGSGCQTPTPFCCAAFSRWAFPFPARTFSLEHRGTAHLVHHPRQQKRLLARKRKSIS